jgi:exo-1,4-beta-D-glucosaminidase
MLLWLWIVLLELSAAAASVVELSSCEIMSSSFVYSDGVAISSPSFDTTGWYNVSLPSTIMAGLLENDVYPDPFFSDNLKLIPTDIFDVSWWYRCVFHVPSQVLSLLTFTGINYKANVWIDGKSVGNTSSIVGTFVNFDFRVPASESTTHVAAVQVFRPFDRAIGPGASADMDLAISFVDWAPYPPDSNMGKFSISFLLRLQYFFTYQRFMAACASDGS